MNTHKPGNRNFLDYRQFLVDELQRRQKRNPAYSLRAFSRDLGIGSSRLSEIINSKVGLSEDRAVIIAEKLQLADAEKSLFVDLVQGEHARSSLAKQAALKRVRDRMLQARKIEKEDFSLISDWYNLALIELLNVDGLEHSVESFAKRLGIRETVIAETIERLKHLGYIGMRDGRWIPTEPETTTDKDIPSMAIREYHRQILDKAKSAIEDVPLEKRDFSSAVFALNSKQLQYAKERIHAFRRSLVKDLEEMPDKDGVYCLSLQFFELTGKQ